MIYSVLHFTDERYWIAYKPFYILYKCILGTNDESIYELRSNSRLVS